MLSSVSYSIVLDVGTTTPKAKNNPARIRRGITFSYQPHAIRESASSNRTSRVLIVSSHQRDKKFRGQGKSREKFGEHNTAAARPRNGVYKSHAEVSSADFWHGEPNTRSKTCAERCTSSRLSGDNGYPYIPLEAHFFRSRDRTPHSPQFFRPGT